MNRLKNWWQLRKYHRSIRRMQKARLQTRIARQHRIKLQTMHPERETLPASVWIREFARHVWDSLFLRFYPVSWLEKRVDD